MSFTVTASTPSREVSFSAGSRLAALEKAMQLSGTGKQNVQVIDGSGRVYSAGKPKAEGRAKIAALRECYAPLLSGDPDGT